MERGHQETYKSRGKSRRVVLRRKGRGWRRGLRTCNGNSEEQGPPKACSYKAWELGLDLKSSGLHLDLAAVATGQGSGMRKERSLSWLHTLLL